MSVQPITLIRNGDQWVTSWDIYARQNGYPIEEGDGVFVTNLTIQPYEDSAATTWPTPNNGTWYFSAISKYQQLPGIFNRLDLS